MRNFLVTSLVLIAVFFGLHSPAEANLLNDPGFELGGSAISLKDGPWTWDGGSNGGAFYTSHAARSGSKSAKTVVWGGAASDSAYFVEDITGSFSDAYNFSGYFLHSSSDPLQDGSTVQLELSWKNSSDAELRKDVSAVFDNSWAADTWHLLSMSTSPAPVGAVKVSAVTVLKSNNAYTPDSAVFTDDMDFDVVPEPSSIVLLGCGLIGLISLGIRKK
ncbi:MAG: PEP-CTERM sorting domain-containing protein [Candidatus Auribacterota bacterium]|nr:PEP-CTERM sorting domain-containing protein [Candidatus Auribacterota bacterium]